MNKGLKRFFIICVIILGAGIILTVAGYAMGGIKDANRLASEYSWWEYRDTSNMTTMYLEEAEAFNSIEVSGTMDVNIVTGAEQTYISYNPGSCTPQLAVEGGILRVDSDYLDNGGVLDFGFTDNDIPMVWIYVPEGTVLNSIGGTMELGDVTITGVTVGSINIKADLGDIEVYNASVSKLTLDADLGDVQIRMPFTEDQYTLTADVSLGEISINERDYEAFDKHYVSGAGPNVINISVDTGDVDIEFGGIHSHDND
ncbi:MAG: DUF4097 family beta strand repeat protein [Clostridiales bacterium]|nr:DUF4097 family beta strand repeat protein [Clostridiales bacterium]